MSRSYDLFPNQLSVPLAASAAAAAVIIRQNIDTLDFAYHNAERSTHDVILIDAWSRERYPSLSTKESLRESVAGQTWAADLLKAIDTVRHETPRLTDDSGAQLFFVPPFVSWRRHRDLAQTYRTVTNLKGATRVWVEDTLGGEPLEAVLGVGDTYGMQFTEYPETSPLHEFETLAQERIALLLG